MAELVLSGMLAGLGILWKVLAPCRKLSDAAELTAQPVNADLAMARQASTGVVWTTALAVILVWSGGYLGTLKYSVWLVALALQAGAGLIGIKRTRAAFTQASATVGRSGDRAWIEPLEVISGRLPAIMTPLWLLVAATGYTDAVFERLPEKLPVHWGLQGPDRWAPKTPRDVFGPFGAFTALLLGLALLAATAARDAQRLERAIDEVRQFRWWIRWLVLLEWLMLVPALLPILQIFWPQSVSKVLLGWASFLILTLIWTLMGALRDRRKAKVAGSTPFEARRPQQVEPAPTRRTLFYAVREDPSVVVLKPNGLGLTLNFARWEAWGLLLILVLPPLILALTAN